MNSVTKAIMKNWYEFCIKYNWKAEFRIASHFVEIWVGMLPMNEFNGVFICRHDISTSAVSRDIYSNRPIQSLNLPTEKEFWFNALLIYENLKRF